MIIMIDVGPDVNEHHDYDYNEDGDDDHHHEL